MIDKFGQIMLYVNNPRNVADFWIEKVGFIEVTVQNYENGEQAIEIAPYSDSDANFVLFDRKIVEKTSPGVNLGCPSILFSSYNLKDLREKLLNNGVNVSEISVMEGIVNMHFPDPEGNYFAIKEIEKN